MRTQNPWVPSNLRGLQGMNIPSWVIMLLLGYSFYKIIDSGWSLIARTIRGPTHNG